jgi:predicted permease
VTELEQDFRYAARQLRRMPGFTVAAVVTLALGVGAHTAFFSVVNAIAFRPIAGVQLDRIYAIQAVRPNGRQESSVSLAGLRALERDLPADALAVGAVRDSQLTVQGAGRAEVLMVDVVSGGFAGTFGLLAQQGRWIGRDDDRDGVSQRVAVISDRLWREWFGADPGVVGRMWLKAATTPLTIIGVAPREFSGLLSHLGQHTDLWMPAAAWAEAASASPRFIESVEFPVFIRSRTTGTPSTALAGALHTILSRQPGPQNIFVRPGGFRTADVSTHVLVPAEDVLRRSEATRVGLILLSLSGLVLLAACANFANMLYARNAARAGELAIRLSLGAGRWRAIRLLLAEAGLIGLLAGGLGLLIGSVGVAAFQAVFPTLEISSSQRFAFNFDLDWHAVLSALAAGIAAACIAGGASGWRATRIQPTALTSSSGLSTASTARGRMRRTLVAVQVTAAVLLVMAAGLFVEELTRQMTRRLHVHYDKTPLTAARVDVGLHEYPESRGHAFFEQWLDEARRLPGVERAALTDAVPGGERASFERTTVIAESQPGMSGYPPRIGAGFVRVSPGFFATLGIELVAGRDFGPGDAAGAPRVAILSANAAEALWPGQDPLGKRLTVEGSPVTVVGMSPNLVSGFRDVEAAWSEQVPGTRPSNTMFVPFAQYYRANMFVIVRSPGTAQADALRMAVQRIDENVAVRQAASVASMLSWLDYVWAAASVMFGLAAVALAIAMLGVYGVVAFFVSTRTREFGIRLALGATPRGLMKLVVDYSLHVILVGLLPAVFIAAVGSRLIESRRFDLMPNEISTWVVVPLVLVAAGIVAGYFPARRAARVDPNVALRNL